MLLHANEVSGNWTHHKMCNCTFTKWWRTSLSFFPIKAGVCVVFFFVRKCTLPQCYLRWPLTVQNKGGNNTPAVLCSPAMMTRQKHRSRFVELEFEWNRLKSATQSFTYNVWWIPGSVCLRFVRRLDDENNQFGQQTTRSSFASSVADCFPLLFKYSDIENLIENGNNLCTEGTLTLRSLHLGDIYMYMKIWNNYTSAGNTVLLHWIVTSSHSGSSLK